MRRVLQFSQFGTPHQYTTIAAGASGRVFYFSIPKGLVGFIKLVANNWFENTYYIWIIDGEVIDPRLERTLGLVDRPKVYDPPIAFKSYIEFIVYNNSDDSQVFEVMCDGDLYEKGGKG